MKPVHNPTFYSYAQTQRARESAPCNQRLGGYGAHWGHGAGMAVAETLTMLPRVVVGMCAPQSPQLLARPSTGWRDGFDTGGVMLVANKALISGCTWAGTGVGQGAGALAALIGTRCGCNTEAWAAKGARKGAQLGWLVGLLPCGLSEIARGTVSFALTGLNEAFARACGLVLEVFAAIAELLFAWIAAESFGNPLDL